METDPLTDIQRRLVTIEAKLDDLGAAITVAGPPAGVTTDDAVAPAPFSTATAMRPALPLATTVPRSVPAARASAPRVAAQTPAQVPDPAPTAAPSRRLTEQLVGAKGLALVGGAAVLLGLVFFVSVAIQRGLIPMWARMSGAAVLAGLLLLVAERLDRRDGDRTLIGVLATVGVIGELAVIIASTGHLALLPRWTSLGLSPIVGALAVWAADRFRMPFLAGIGSTLALLAPSVAGLPIDDAHMIYVLGLFAAMGLLAVQRGWLWMWPIGLTLTSLFAVVWIYNQTDGGVFTVGNGPALAAVVTMLLISLATAVAGDRVWAPNAVIAKGVPPILSLATTLVALLGVTALTRADQPKSLANTWMTVLGVGLLAIGAAVFSRRRERLIGPLIAALGFVTLAVAFAMWTDGPGLVVAWSAQAVVGAVVARRVGDDRVLVASVLTLCGAIVAAVRLAPPRGLGWSIADAATGVTAVLVVAAALVAVSLLVRGLPERFLTASGSRPQLIGALGAIVALYGVSVALVQALGTAHQYTQVSLSVFWAIVGLGLIVVGLVRDLAPVRWGGLTLLGVSLGKLVLFDLRYLSSVNRAVSFILVGLLALAGAYAYQRVREHLEEDDVTPAAA